MTVPVVLASLTSDYYVFFTLMMAICLLGLLPTVFLAMLMRKYIVQGLSDLGGAQRVNHNPSAAPGSARAPYAPDRYVTPKVFDNPTRPCYNRRGWVAVTNRGSHLLNSIPPSK